VTKPRPITAITAITGFPNFFIFLYTHTPPPPKKKKTNYAKLWEGVIAVIAVIDVIFP
jgi:hypothetical protein